jgi:hypothetical protein
MGDPTTNLALFVGLESVTAGKAFAGGVATPYS